MKTLRLILFVLPIMLMNFNLYAQPAFGNQGAIWYFGQTAGLSFCSGSPVPLLDGQLSTNEGCATISDQNCNLLFYTDGSFVYDANHNIMSNSLVSSPGGELNGNSSSTQSGVIVPVGNNSNFYYIFTVDDNHGIDGCCYSLVNMNLNGGFGNVVLSSKNMPLLTPASEKIAAVRHGNGVHYWVIIHKWGTADFYTYLVTNGGINQTPIISNAGAVYTGNYSVARGYLKPSPDGTLLCAAIEGLDRYEMFHFDDATGQITFFYQTYTPYPDAYGVEFSPDGSILYGSLRWGNAVYQWDLSSGFPGTILSSVQQIATLSTNYGGALQLGVDQKIYLARRNQSYLGVINNPDVLGAGVTGCHYVEPGVGLAGRTSKEGLPTFICSFFDIPDFECMNHCVGDSSYFFIPDTAGLDSVFWYFDDPQSVPNISWDWQPWHVFSDTGTYEVMLVFFHGGLGDTILQNITIYGYPEFHLGNDTTVCTGASMLLDVGIVGADYFWSDGTTTQTNTVSVFDTLTVWAEVIETECLSKDSITFYPFDLSSDFTVSDLICNGDEVTITYTGNAGILATYNWDFDDGNVISGTGEGPYQVSWSSIGSHTVSLVVELGDCISDTSYFQVENPPGLEMLTTGDDVDCFGGSDGAVYLSVSGGTGAYSYLWNVGYTTQNIIGVPAGVYMVSVIYNSICTDTVSYEVKQPDAPVLGQVETTDITCFGNNDGQVLLTPSGGTSPYSYQWANSDASTQLVQQLYAGYYSVTVTDSLDCVFSTGVLVNEPDELSIEASMDVTICEGESTVLSSQAFGGVSPYQYAWVGVGAAQSINVSPVSETTYFVNATDSNGCVSPSAPVTVSLYPPVSSSITVQADSICSGDSTIIFANFAGGNGGPYACKVNGVETEVPYSVKPEETTTYEIIGYDDCGSPTNSSIITIVVMDIPSSGFDADIYEGCAPLTVNFQDANAEPGQKYMWHFGEENSNNFSVAKDPTHVYEVPGVYDVALSTTSRFGCEFEFRFPEMITVHEKPQASFVADPTYVSILEANVYFKNLSQPYIQSYWNYGDGNTEQGYLADAWHIYTDTGWYQVTLIVESNEFCRDTISQSVYVYDEGGTAYTPTAFNPNSAEEQNRVFRPRIHGIDPMSFHMIVYDRWGEKIFETYNYDKGWDGSVKGKGLAKIGAYPWLVIFKDLNGKNQKLSGSVMVVDN